MLMYSDIVSSQEGAPRMITSSLIRWWELLGAVLGGLAWLVSVLLDSASAPQEPLFLVYAIAWLGTLGGLVGLYALQASSYLLLGTSSFFAAFIGALLALAGTVLNLLSRGDLLQQGFYERIAAVAPRNRQLLHRVADRPNKLRAARVKRRGRGTMDRAERVSGSGWVDLNYHRYHQHCRLVRLVWHPDTDESSKHRL